MGSLTNTRTTAVTVDIRVNNVVTGPVTVPAYAYTGGFSSSWTVSQFSRLDFDIIGPGSGTPSGLKVYLVS